MDDTRFDALTRSLAGGTSRRRVLKGLFGSLVGGATLATGMHRAAAEDPPPDDGTTTTPAPDLVETSDLPVCLAEHTCGGECCESWERCCEGYCIPSDACCWHNECGECGECQQGKCYYPQCCGDWDCGPCESCYEGECRYTCNLGQDCCEDEKGGYCAYCCGDWDCEGCDVCHGGYCIDICADQGLYCCANQTDVVSTEGGKHGCSECCHSEDCGPCERCYDGWCKPACEKDEVCCDWGCEAECCYSEDCGDCQECVEGYCRHRCEQDEICCANGPEAYCTSPGEGCCGGFGDWCTEVSPLSGNLNGRCCDGLLCCYDDRTKGASCAECCDDWDCPENWVCCGGYCAECCDDKGCERGVCVDGWCAECRDHWDCGKGEVCCEGGCYEGECCTNHDCDDCEYCDQGWCRPSGVGFGDICSPPNSIFSAEGISPQLNCCDGLFCCETGKHGLDLVCLQCCHDGDCAHGCDCIEGACSCGCSHDKDCAHGTCCCKNGSCSADCCPKKPDMPHKPDDSGKTPETSGGVTVNTLPSTGSGDSQSSAGWIGAAALGAAAAYLVSKQVKDDAPEPEVAEE